MISVQERVYRRFEARFRNIPTTTTALLVVLTALHVADGLDSRPRYAWWAKLLFARPEAALVRWGARDGRAVEDGEVWRLLSYGFLHWDWGHLALNGLALWGLGRFLEAIFGPVRFLWLFVVSIVGGGLFSQTADRDVVSAGASGGIFGLLGALVVFGVLRRASLPDELRALFGWKLWPWILLNLGVGLLLPFIDNRAHVGGLVAGSLAVLPLGDHITSNRVPNPTVSIVIMLMLTVLLSGAAGMVMLR
jgi:membrane associated rhomboid family serine protease